LLLELVDVLKDHRAVFLKPRTRAESIATLAVAHRFIERKETTPFCESGAGVARVGGSLWLSSRAA
jgi:hypothetical protein